MQDNQSEKVHYTYLLKRHLSDPDSGITDDELRWMQNYEKENPSDPEVAKRLSEQKDFDKFFLKSLTKTGSEKLGFGPGVPSLDERLEKQLERVKSRLHNEAGIDIETQEEKDRQIKRNTWYNKAIAVAAAVIILAAIVGYDIKPFYSSEYYDEARLTLELRRDLEHNVKSVDDELDSFSIGARALLDAPDKGLLGFRKDFHKTEVEKALLHLMNFYESESDPYQKARAAFYLAKAYLMNSDRVNAEIWLQKVQGSGAKEYRDRADSLLKSLRIH